MTEIDEYIPRVSGIFWGNFSLNMNSRISVEYYVLDWKNMELNPQHAPGKRLKPGQLIAYTSAIETARLLHIQNPARLILNLIDTFY
ncbi:hypothetical protein ACHAP8_000009 [Fusarium lateritium]